jgi:hypothetical protein
MENRRGRPVRVWLQRRSNPQDGGWETCWRTGQFRETGHEKPVSKPRVHAPIDLDLNNAAPGDYLLDYKLHDLGTEKTTTVELPFTIEQ